YLEKRREVEIAMAGFGVYSHSPIKSDFLRLFLNVGVKKAINAADAKTENSSSTRGSSDSNSDCLERVITKTEPKKSVVRILADIRLSMNMFIMAFL
ncbi:hypothetical protein, partial [Vibrio sp. 10N.261.49.A11]